MAKRESKTELGGRIAGETRNLDQIREHYEIEKALARRLLNSTKEERFHLYGTSYDELYARVPLHPQFREKADPALSRAKIRNQLGLVERILKSKMTFMEIGPGDCSFSFEVAKRVRNAVAIDVTAEMAGDLDSPANFELMISDGINIPVADCSIDLAYSNQLVEHLHPNDAMEQLKDIHRSLVETGVYVCNTPSRLNGPHDVSKYFDDVATCFHLKEYTFTELRDMFLKVGFSRIRTYVGGGGVYLRVPVVLLMTYERFIDVLPRTVRKRLNRNAFYSGLLAIHIMGIK